MLPVMSECISVRRRIRKNSSDLKLVGEPDAVKVARPVRGRVVGKVPRDGNSLATYPTPRLRGVVLSNMPASNVLWRFRLGCFRSGRGLGT